MLKKLMQAGVEVTGKRFCGAAHGFTMAEDEAGIAGQQYMIDYIKENLIDSTGTREQDKKTQKRDVISIEKTSFIFIHTSLYILAHHKKKSSIIFNIE